jgi:hypothetical protein
MAIIRALGRTTDHGNASPFLDQEETEDRQVFSRVSI